MTRSCRISHLAEIDLEEIWLYTFKNWSLAQADKYYHILIESIRSICENPELGISIDHIKHGYRIRHVKSHIVVYKFDSQEVWIDRILHQRMDIESRLVD